MGARKSGGARIAGLRVLPDEGLASARIVRDEDSGDDPAMERTPLPDGFLAVDVDRRDASRWWIYLHGFGSNRSGSKATAFRTAAETEGVSFVTYDARGHGESSGMIETVTLSKMIEDLSAAIDALVPPSASLVLIGSSLGGVTAAWYAAANPKRVKANVLIAPAFRFVDRFLAEIGPEAAADWKSSGAYTVGKTWMWIPLKYGIVEDAAGYDESDLAKRYRTDTLVIHGKQDGNVPWQVSTEFGERCPHRPLDVVLIDDGDHRFEGRGAELTDRAREFLARVAH